MFINRGLVEQTTVHPHNEVLRSVKQMRMISICYYKDPKNMLLSEEKALCRKMCCSFYYYARKRDIMRYEYPYVETLKYERMSHKNF